MIKRAWHKFLQFDPTTEGEEGRLSTGQVLIGAFLFYGLLFGMSFSF